VRDCGMPPSRGKAALRCASLVVPPLECGLRAALLRALSCVLLACLLQAIGKKTIKEGGGEPVIVCACVFVENLRERLLAPCDPTGGCQVQKGNIVKVHCTGTLENGTKFWSTRDPDQEPYEFPIG
jgi:hypothetical protein